MQENTCDNCQAKFDSAKEGLLTTNAGRLASAVCGGCIAGTRKVKIVLRRGEVGGFAYDQYQAIEMAKAAG